ncbi:MAG: UDP-N-acetylmuramoyl-L-alanine--D-glutamate ligase [Candidatus Tectomicrobia bacterium]|nr:UDP-N-acetylmuramoyl-L-alanine--D-glutamate ligase [Candidatus Tectomicrobia bacterium]
MDGDLQGKRVTVVGCGRSGVAAAHLLVARGAQVTVTDEQPAAALRAPEVRLPAAVRRRFGGFRQEDFLTAQQLIVSPGVAYDHPLLARARAAGVRTRSELELAFTQMPPPGQRRLVAITGTNGKTTVTSWIGTLLEAAGMETRVCGNIGHAFSAAVLEPPAERYVVEVSSFQLEGIERFRPAIGVLLNITPDHLDRHGSLERYRDLKLRLAEQQQPDDALIVNLDDPQLAGAEPPGQARRYATSRRAPVEQGAFVRHGLIVLRLRGEERVLGPRSLLRLTAVHDEENLLAALLAAALAGAPLDALAAAVPNLTRRPHRLELLGEIEGAPVFNDSKATNIGAVQKALENFAPGVILLLGGQNKGLDFSPLADAVAEKVALLVLFGGARRVLATALRGTTAMVEAATLAEAVEVSLAHAAPGRVILLSPGCTSFDEFANYEERGERFKTLVREAMARTPEASS